MNARRIVMLAVALLVLAAVAYGILARGGAFDLTLAELRQRYAAPDSKFATVRGVEVHYRDEGAGPVLVLINGSWGNLRTWDGVVGELKGRYRLVRFDIAPQGLSGSVSDAVAKSGVDLADLIKALLDRLGIAKATIVGVSSGGTEAFRFAAKYPGAVDAVVLSQTPSFPVPVPTQPLTASAIFISDTLLHHRSHLAWRIFLKPLWHDRSKVTPAVIDEYYDFNRRVPERNGRALIPYSNKQPIISAQLAKVVAPTLLVWGDDDPVLPLPTMQKLRDHLTSTKVQEVVLKGVGHYPPLEAPTPFAATLDTYLRGIGVAKP